MSFSKCLEDQYKKSFDKYGKARQEKMRLVLEKLKRDYDNRRARLAGEMAEDQADLQAATEALEAFQSNFDEAKIRKMRHGIKLASIITDVEKRGIKYSEKAVELSENVMTRSDTVFRQLSQDMNEFIEKGRSKYAGLVRDTKFMPDVIREMGGRKTGNGEAARFSAALRNVYDKAGNRFRNAGGLLETLEDYYPQMHAPNLLRKVTEDEWKDFLFPLLDRGKMIDFETGLPITDERLLEMMSDDFKDILTNGRHTKAKRIDAGQDFFSGVEVYKRKANMRFYRFKSPDDFLIYNEKFGTGKDGLYDLVINSIKSFSNDIALLETYGPLPNEMNRGLVLRASTEGSHARERLAQASYDIVSGVAGSTAQDSRWFGVVAGSQNLIRAALLPAAPLSALSDAAFLTLAAKVNGLPQTAVLKRYTSLMNPLAKEDREIAKASGLIHDIVHGQAIGEERYAGESMAYGATATLANFTNVGSGLRYMTTAAKNAATLELEAMLAREVKKPFASLGKEFKAAAIAHGITEQDWAILRKIPAWVPKDGVGFLGSKAIFDHIGSTEDAIALASKIDDWGLNIGKLATNEPTVMTKAITTGQVLGDARKGTALRAFVSSVMMLKSFPITVMNRHLFPYISRAKQGDYSYLAQMLLLGTTLGGVAIMSKDLSQGKTPRAIDGNFVMAALLQSGGLGIMGDFMFAKYNRFGQDPLVSLMGPVFGLSSDTMRLLKGSFDRALEDGTEKAFDNFRRDAFKYVKRYNPVAVPKFWYTRLVAERLMFDEMERIINPRFEADKRRIEKRMRDDYGQEYWWRP